MEESYLLACRRYVEYNPVRAGLAERPEDWKWSSAGAHRDDKDDILVKTSPLLRIVNTPWGDFLFLIVMHLKLNCSENMNGPADRWERRLL